MYIPGDFGFLAKAFGEKAGDCIGDGCRHIKGDGIGHIVPREPYSDVLLTGDIDADFVFELENADEILQADRAGILHTKIVYN